MVGAGSVVTHDVPARAIVMGSPARIVGYVDTESHAQAGAESGVLRALPGGARLVRLGSFADLRGLLSVAEVENHVPFVPRRAFFVSEVPGKEARGEHAHRQCHQFLICVSGSLSVIVDDGRARHEVKLDSPSLGLYLPPLIWSVQYRFSSDAALAVLASDPYDAGDYIRDYEEFLKLVSAARV
jgi:hypothetical protein